MNSALQALGWTQGTTVHPDLILARVATVERSAVGVAGLESDPSVLRFVPVAPRLREAGADAPAIGDWVLCHPLLGFRVEKVLDRKSELIRKRAGRTSLPQVVAANVDRVFIVTAVGEDLSVRRLERYVAAVRAGRSEPVIVLNKCDRPHDPEEVAVTLGAITRDVPWIRTEATHSGGVEELARWLVPGSTVAFVGSSGVGKSSLINAVTGTTLSVGSTRDSDDTGQHTTTRRTLLLAGGFVVIDTPGMRELGMYDAQPGLEETFADVAALAEDCRFRDCSHRHEPGCAVRAAIDAEAVDLERVEAYRSLVDENAQTRSRSDERNAKSRWKQIHRGMNERRKLHKKLGLKDI